MLKWRGAPYRKRVSIAWKSPWSDEILKALYTGDPLCVEPFCVIRTDQPPQVLGPILNAFEKILTGDGRRCFFAVWVIELGRISHYGIQLLLDKAADIYNKIRL